MSLWNSLLEFCLGKKQRRVLKWRGKPLYRKGKDIYWKGYRVGDDYFDALMRDEDERRQYNYYVKIANRKLRQRNRNLRRKKIKRQI
jgi:hypothetical protein